MADMSQTAKKVACENHPQVMIAMSVQETSSGKKNNIVCKFYTFDWGENAGYCTFDGKRKYCFYG